MLNIIPTVIIKLISGKNNMGPKLYEGEIIELNSKIDIEYIRISGDKTYTENRVPTKKNGKKNGEYFLNSSTPNLSLGWLAKKYKLGSKLAKKLRCNLTIGKLYFLK